MRARVAGFDRSARDPPQRYLIALFVKPNSWPVSMRVSLVVLNVALGVLVFGVLVFGVFVFWCLGDCEAPRPGAAAELGTLAGT